MNTIRTDMLTALRNDPVLVALLPAVDHMRHEITTEEVPAPFITFAVAPQSHNAQNGTYRDHVTFTAVDKPGNPSQTARAVIGHISDTFLPQLVGQVGDTCVLCLCEVKSPAYRYDELREEIYWTLVAEVIYKST